jgi:hypothetical protein
LGIYWIEWIGVHRTLICADAAAVTRVYAMRFGFGTEVENEADFEPRSPEIASELSIRDFR